MKKVDESQWLKEEPSHISDIASAERLIGHTLCPLIFVC